MIVGRFAWLLAGAALFAAVLVLAAVVAESASGPQPLVDQSPSVGPPLSPEPRPPGAGELPELRLEPDDPVAEGEPEVDGVVRMPGFTGRVTIELRGDFSVALPKKSYAIELDSPTDEDREAPLLGMPANGDWVLQAPYADKTLIRNALAYDASRSLGRYAPRTRFVELFLDDRYRGVYVLTETPELGAQRVAGDGLLELTSLLRSGVEDEAFRAPVTGRPVVWRDPAREDLEDERAEAIERLVGRAERALYSPPLGAPGGDWRRHLDASAAVDFVLLGELFKSPHAFESSTYLARRADGRLHLGPVWDLDAAMGNSALDGGHGVTGWALERRDWAERLYRDRGFVRAVAKRWRESRDEGLRERLLEAIDRHRRLLNGEAVRNFRRWRLLGASAEPTDLRRGYHDEVDELQRWLIRRIAWIDANVERLGER